MRIDRQSAVGAIAGDREDFEAVVRAYYPVLLAYLGAFLRGREDAEDAVQDVFLRAYTAIGTLRDPEALEPWLFASARNAARRAWSKGRRERASREEGHDLNTAPDPGGERSPLEGAMASEALAELLPALSEEEADLVALRYLACLSLGETALAAGIPTALAKSRLHEALERMRARARRGEGPGGPRLPIVRRPRRGSARIHASEDRIMDRIDQLRFGARAFSRLSLHEQIHVGRLAQAGLPLDEAALAAFGEQREGAAFLASVRAALPMDELVEILNYVDRDTEKRFIDELDIVDPELSERFKRLMFVFEDFCLFDGKALAKLIASVGTELFATALAGIMAQYREAILVRMDAGLRTSVEEAQRGKDGNAPRAKTAMERCVAEAREMDRKGLLRSTRPNDATRGEPLFTADD